MAILISGTTNDITINGASIATDAEVSSAVAPKANTADLKEIGVGQTWQLFAVGTQRIAGTTYTNTTGKPIMVASDTGSTSSDTGAIVNGITVLRQANTGASVAYPFVFIVPSGGTYSIAATALQSWKELR